MQISRGQLAGLMLASAAFGAIVASAIAAARPSSSHPRPLVSGHTNYLMLWNKPIISPANEGAGVDPGSQVDVYENYLIVTTPKGIKILCPAGHYGPVYLGP